MGINVNVKLDTMMSERQSVLDVIINAIHAFSSLISVYPVCLVLFELLIKITISAIVMLAFMISERKFVQAAFEVAKHV